MVDVGLTTKNAMERAYKLGHTEARARALVDSAVAYSMRNRGEPDERDFERYACNIATDATMMLLQYIYENDAELNTTRAERDHYKRLVEAHLLTTQRIIASVDTLPITDKPEPYTAKRCRRIMSKLDED